MSKPIVSYLQFERDAVAEEGKKTEVWLVLSKSHGTVLGRIKWFGRWRQYTFFPEPEMVFNPACLTEIASHCTQLTAAQRAKHVKTPAPVRLLTPAPAAA